MRLNKITQITIEVLVGSAKVIPIPIELPAWKAAATRKIPIPTAIPIGFPHLSLIVVSKDLLVAIPIRDDICIKTIIKKIATTIIQRRE